MQLFDENETTSKLLEDGFLGRKSDSGSNSDPAMIYDAEIFPAGCGSTDEVSNVSS